MGTTKLKSQKRDSGVLYKSLFNMMSEGVAVNEIIYDKSGRAIDYKIVAVNPAFEIITGLKKRGCYQKTGV